MSTKTKMLINLLVLLIILFIVYFFWQTPFANHDNQTQTEQITSANLDNTNKIEITIDNEVTSFEKLNEQWVITSQDNVLANTIMIENIIDALKETNEGTIISQNPDKLAIFDLSEGTFSQLKLSDAQGNEIATLLIGKAGGANYDKTYVTKLNSNNTILLDTNLNSLINQNDWTNPEPIPEPKEAMIEENVIE